MTFPNGSPHSSTPNSNGANGAARPAIDRFEELVGNALLSRSELLKKFLDPRRSIDDECGYPTNAPRIEDYQLLFDREPIPNRVVSVLAKESWQAPPTVFETDDSEEVTEFETAWDELGSALRGEASFYQDEENNPVWEYLLRADILSGIGSFGILLLGIDDDRPMSEPLEGVEESFFPDKDTGKKGKAGGKGEKPRTQKNGSASPNGKSAPGNVGEGNGKGAAFLGGMKVNPPTGYAGINPSPVGPGAPTLGTPATYPGVGTDALYFRGLGTGETLTGDPNAAEEEPAPSKRKLLYLRVLPESLVQISQYEYNPKSPRFGQPLLYLITLNDPRLQTSGAMPPTSTLQVHWTRVIHIADNLDSSEVLGKPRMAPVYNRLLDLRKLYAGSAEMYWRGAFPGYVLSTHPQLGGDVAVDREQLRDDMEKYMNGLQRYMMLMGMSMTGLAPQVVDPSAQINVQIEAICIQLGCPVRIFKGSERGELSSTQDESAWNSRLKLRQRFYITPRLIIPFIDRLIAAGVLPKPQPRPKPEIAELGRKMIEAGMTDDTVEGAGAPLAVGSDSSNPSLASRSPVGASRGGGMGIPPLGADRSSTGRVGVPRGIHRRRASVPSVNEEGNRSGRGRSGEGDPSLGKWTHRVRLVRSFVYNADTGEVEEGPPKEEVIDELHIKAGYKVSWPDLTASSDAERAAVLAQRTAAYAQYISGGMEKLVSPIDYMVNFDGMDEAEAKAILETAEKEAAAKAEEAAAQNPLAAAYDAQGNPLGADGQPLPPGAAQARSAPGKPIPGQVPLQLQKPGQPAATAPNPAQQPLSTRPGAPKTSPIPPQFRK